MNALPDPQPLTEVSECDRLALPDDVLRSSEPIVLRGLVADWPAVEHCNSSAKSAAGYVTGFWSGEPVTVYVADASSGGRFFYDDDFTGFNFRSGKARLDQVFEKMAAAADGEESEVIYVGSTAVDRWLPGFQAANELALPHEDTLVSFWLGNRTRVSAHFDFPDNIACVVAGRRRFTLFPPEQVANLYVGPVDRTPSGQAISVVDAANPDLERFPKFADAMAASRSAELEPGDAIFIPSMWWHQVESFDDLNLLVNYWWCDSPRAMGSPMTALMHGMLALRDLPARQREAWRQLFNYYVFDADASVYEHIPESGRGCLAPLDDVGARRLRAELLNRLNR